MQKLIISLSFIYISLTAFSQDFNIRGFLYDEENGEPVLFEKVVLLKLDSTTYSGAVTDVNGFFSIVKIQIGEYILSINNGDYEKIEERISVTEDKGNKTVKFNLKKSEQAK